MSILPTNVFANRPQVPHPSSTQMMQAAFSSKAPIDVLVQRLSLDDPYAQDTLGRTALMLAAWNGGDQKVRVLLPFSDVLAQDNKGVDALMFAAGMGTSASVQTLLDYSNPQATDHKGWTALTHAARGGKPLNLPVLLNVSKVEQLDVDGMTLLMHAVVGGAEALEAVLAIVPAAMLDHRDGKGMTALMHATLAKQPDMVERLLRAGADPTIVDNEGMTALMHAAGHHAESMNVLLPVSDVQHRDLNGRTLLMLAADGMEALSMALDVTPDALLNARDASGQSALHRVARCRNIGQAEVWQDFQALLQRPGLDLNLVDEQGATALMVAATFANRLMLKALLNAGANPDAMDPEGMTALHLVQNDRAMDGEDDLMLLSLNEMAEGLIDRMTPDVARGALLSWNVDADGSTMMALWQRVIDIEQQRLRAQMGNTPTVSAVARSRL